LLKSAPENSGNLPSPEAAPPSTFLEKKKSNPVRLTHEIRQKIIMTKQTIWV
jgi:hypothetical protein